MNYQGTVNLCKALEQSHLPKALIFISTVAAYGLEYGENVTEDYPLKGKNPYSLSKIQAEQFLTDWCKETRCNFGNSPTFIISRKKSSRQSWRYD